MEIKTEQKFNIFKRNGHRKLPYIIAGPCSAETEDQLLKTCTQLIRTGRVDALRAGIWKPRTRPDSFEGIGAKGLPWLKKLKDLTGIPVCVEVAKASHVQLCLEFEIDILWIGARTTVNPFAVQEIAEAIKGHQVPILVKSPVNPDLSLWLGAVERIQRAGINHIGVVHRGFSNFGEKIYRNKPQWQIPIEFKRRRPEIGMICDPSHICGNRELIHDVAQKALDLDYDGLMIECHIDPDNAWSDAKQQITPVQFNDLLQELVLREDFEDVLPVQNELDRLRHEIDHIDDEILHLLANRMKVSRQIGHYKKENNVTILQAKRWNEILEKVREKASKVNLNEEFVYKILNNVHIESINQQEDILNPPES